MKPGGQYKILVVDDSPQDVRVMLDSLSQTYDAFFALDGPEALRIAEREYPDLALLDIYMAGMDGFEVCRRLKRIPKIAENPVIFITGSPDEADHVKGLELGAVDFIAKPINTTVLKQRVALHLRLISAIKDGLIEIEARKRAEEMLQKRERRYRNLFENGSDLICLHDLEGKLLETNLPYKEEYGWQKQDLEGLNIREMIPERHRSKFDEYLARMLKSGADEGYLKGFTKSGKEVTLEYRNKLILDENGKPRAVQGAARDVTQRIKSEKALKISESNYRQLFNAVPDAIIIVDAETSQIVDVNPAALRLYGYSHDEICRLQAVDLSAEPQKSAKHIRQVLSKKSSKGSPEIVQLLHKSKAGIEFPVEIAHGFYIRDGRKMICAIMRDISERKRIKDELAKVQKLESLGVLAGGIAHDFNNILTAIIGNLSLAKMDSAPDGQVMARLNEMENASLQAKDLTQQLLTFSKGGEPVKKLVTLTELVKNAATFSLRGSNVRCNFSISQDLLPVEVDEGQIGQVINNLVLNADHAMPEGGILKISSDNITLSAGNEFALAAGPYLKTSFRDHGVGIHPDHLPKVFDPYFTTKHKGSGLGLTVAYSIIDKHNGRLTVESDIGHGTTFTIYLPASEKPAIEAADEEKSLFNGKGRILVMDDEKIIRDLAVQMLGKIGYEVSVAIDGDQAIEMYRQAQKTGKPFDIVIMDLTVPGGMGGKEAIRKLKKLDPNIKALVSSGYSNDPIMSNFRDYGFEGVVKKPYRIQDMSNALQSVIKI
jgi:PAS domain S-box-containing protein